MIVTKGMACFETVCLVLWQYRFTDPLDSFYGPICFWSKYP